MTDDRLRDLFREMRDEPVPADSLIRVRTGVRTRIAGRRWLWFGGMGLIPVAALLLLLIFRTPTPVMREIAKRPAEPAIETPAPVVQPAVIRTAPHRAHHRRVEQVAKASPPAIRIETDDPNVVILLVGNE